MWKCSIEFELVSWHFFDWINCGFLVEVELAEQHVQLLLVSFAQANFSIA
jgi:hypothetical protein